MRSGLKRQLAALRCSMIEMGALIEDAITKATEAVVNQNVELARRVIAADCVVDKKEKDIEGQCIALLLNQQPVAGDLRTVSTALKMITDMERIGDQAADIAALGIALAGQKYIKELEHVGQMAQATIKMVNDSIDAYVRKDRELAVSVIEQDDLVDSLFLQIKKDLIELVAGGKSDHAQAFDLLLLAKYYERIGDHATNIAEWVIFSIMGRHYGELDERGQQ